MERLLNLQDQYKFPMGQLIYDKEPDAEATFKMTNRMALKGVRIADFVAQEELQERHDYLHTLSFSPEELGVIERQPNKHYSAAFLGHLAAFRLPEIVVSIDPVTNDLTAETTAPWNDASLWEIPMLSTIPELYYPRLLAKRGISLAKWRNEGDKRGTEFITAMRKNNVPFAEFGTRRRASSEWQDHMIERFTTECPDQFLGTSNPWLAHKYNVGEIGTNAHEVYMGYGALEDLRGGNPLDGQLRFIRDWLARFPGMPVCLIDTFTSDVLLHDLTPELYGKIKNFRIDSGDDREIGNKTIRALQTHGIDPMTRGLMFTNSINESKAVHLKQYFDGTIQTGFGIGGGSVNNMGLTTGLNIVAKLVRIDGHSTVKLSDDEGKHTGATDDVARYKNLVSRALTSKSAASIQLGGELN